MLRALMNTDKNRNNGTNNAYKHRMPGFTRPNTDGKQDSSLRSYCNISIINRHILSI